MQTFFVKLVCFCLFGFIFFAAYQTNNSDLSLSSKGFFSHRTVLVANKLETKSFKVEMQQQQALQFPLTKIN